MSTALFRVEKTHARQDDPVTGNVALGGATRVDGFELGASGRLARHVQVFAGVYLDGEIVELFDNGVSLNGNTLPNAPAHSASVWAVYGSAGAWEIGGGAVYAGERYLNNANIAKVDGYTRLDATVAYKQKDYDLRLNLLRTDVSATLFLAEPSDYDGGELMVEDTYGMHSVKLAAGDMVVYPSSSLHRVNPVTRGARLASFFWVQSMIRDDGRRALLFDVDSAIQRLNATGARVQLTGCYHNLLRMWSEP